MLRRAACTTYVCSSYVALVSPRTQVVSPCEALSLQHLRTQSYSTWQHVNFSTTTPSAEVPAVKAVVACIVVEAWEPADAHQPVTSRDLEVLMSTLNFGWYRVVLTTAGLQQNHSAPSTNTLIVCIAISNKHAQRHFKKNLKIFK